MAANKVLVVAGGGAAGFFCAVNAARINPALEVILLEKSQKFLSKVKISGGGRCNVTHSCFHIPELVTRYPRGKNFLKKTLHWFSPADTVNWFQERGVEIKTEPDGRMFPVTDSSQTIIDCLLNEASKYKVALEPAVGLESFFKEEGKFVLSLSDKRKMACDFLCIACGGFPKMSQFEWLIRNGHTVETPIPSLFSFNVNDRALQQLSGISVSDAQIKIKSEKLSASGPLLITHWGLSGPAILKLSAFGARALAGLNYDFEIVVNWLHGTGYNEQRLRDEWLDLKSANASKPVHKNPFGLPVRLWQYFLDRCGIAHEKRWADINSAEQQKLINLLTAHRHKVEGKTTFKEEFVTAGGIRLNEIDPNTMESKKIPHLFFAGEIMDVDGITGGYNFQHAWTSGWIAAKAIGERG